MKFWINKSYIRKAVKIYINAKVIIINVLGNVETQRNLLSDELNGKKIDACKSTFDNKWDVELIMLKCLDLNLFN